MADLSIEELKALRLCRCGNYKYRNKKNCNKCFLLFGDAGNDLFCEGLQKVRSGKMEYRELFRLLEPGDPPSRKAIMIGLIMNHKIRVSEEDFIFFRKNLERRSAKRKGLKLEPERIKLAQDLNSGVEVYRGFNTAP